MGILDWVEATRLKPEKVKKRIVIILTIIITLVVVLFWLGVTVLTKERQNLEKEEGNNIFSSFLQDIKDIF